MRLKIIILLICILALIVLVAAGLSGIYDMKAYSPKAETQFEALAEEHNEFSLQLAFTGDIMLGSVYPDSFIMPPCHAFNLFDDVSVYLHGADAVFGNLEGVFYEGDALPRICKVPDSCYRFKMPPVYAPALKMAGYDFLSLANNHIYDFGTAGKNFTKKILDSIGISYGGLPEAPTAIREIRGVTLGFIAFAPNAGTLQFRNIEMAAQMVAALKEEVDIVVVSFHGGGEGIDYRHVTRKTEFYRTENRGNPYLFAHSVVDAGADIVFGHGPHVTRGIELYKNKLIMYSLGNFCTYGRFNLKSYCGIAPLMLITVNNQGDFVNGRIVPIVQTGRGKPELDARKRAVFEMQRLSIIDFPESPLDINNEGYISIDEIALKIANGKFLYPL